MRTLQELIDHMKKFKDAVIILGPGINKVPINFTVEDFNEKYNRKTLKRNPDVLWDFYFKQILCEENNSAVYDLVKELDHSIIIDQNYNGKYADIYLHGHINLYRCQKCKTLFPIEGLDLETTKQCECCGGDLRPTVLLSGERYDNDDFMKIKESILNTHTLIAIGMDYNEDSLSNLIADYGEMKSHINSTNPEDTRFLVAIQDKNFNYNPNEIAFFEYLVKDDIESALARLISSY